MTKMQTQIFTGFVASLSLVISLQSSSPLDFLLRRGSYGTSGNAQIHIEFTFPYRESKLRAWGLKALAHYTHYDIRWLSLSITKKNIYNIDTIVISKKYCNFSQFQALYDHNIHAFLNCNLLLSAHYIQVGNSSN